VNKNKSGKVILISGCPRAGKTTLSVKLVKSGLGFSKISLDHLADHSVESIKTLLENLKEEAEVYGINSVFDYYPDSFTLDEIEKLPFRDKLEMYFLGFPDIPIEEIKYNIRYYAKPTDWIYMYDFGDDYLETVAKRIYDFNIKLKSDCKKYNYKFINTGIGEDRNIVLNSLYDEIIKKCR